MALSALLSANSKLSNAARSALGEDTSKAVLASLAPRFGVRRFINIVGSPTNPEAVVRQALANSLTTNVNKDASLFELLSVLCKSGFDEHDGFVLFIDEMGKFLEAASNGKGDVFFFQQLAEFARRSEGRLILVGVLHVAFSDYSGRLPQEAKREWLKVAGRFNDLGLNISGEEQLDLISKAIEITQQAQAKTKCCDVIANEIQSRRRGTSPSISQTLMSCWPLHPAAAPLLANFKTIWTKPKKYFWFPELG